MNEASKFARESFDRTLETGRPHSGNRAGNHCEMDSRQTRALSRSVLSSVQNAHRRSRSPINDPLTNAVQRCVRYRPVTDYRPFRL